jgi:hypothetical protein
LKKQVRFDSPNGQTEVVQSAAKGTPKDQHEASAVIEVHAHGHEEVMISSDRKASPAAPA